MAEQCMLVERMDEALEVYYKKHGCDYDGQFGQCVNVMGLNEDDIVHEFQRDYSDCNFTDFDENFPNPSNHPEYSEARREERFNVLKRYFDIAMSYFDDVVNGKINKKKKKKKGPLPKKQQKNKPAPFDFEKNNPFCCTIDSTKDLSSWISPIQPNKLKKGMWCMNLNTGLPGCVTNINFNVGDDLMMIYKLYMPWFGREISVEHYANHELIICASGMMNNMCKKDYRIVDWDKKSVCCFDEAKNDPDEDLLWLQVSPIHDVYEQVSDAWKEQDKEDRLDAYATVLTGPYKVGDKYQMVQMVDSCRCLKKDRKVNKKKPKNKHHQKKKYKN